MYHYIVKSGEYKKCDIFSDSMKRASILAKTIFPHLSVKIEKNENSSKLCSGCGNAKSDSADCDCWGYS